MASLREALKKALGQVGQTLPSAKEAKRVPPAASPAPPRRPDIRQQQGAVYSSQNHRPQVPPTSVGAIGIPFRPEPPRVGPAKIVVPVIVPPPDCQVHLGANPRYTLPITEDSTTRLLPEMERLGAVEQCLVGVARDEREVVMGLDFGTSSVKVVIGDSALGKSFLVPFNDDVGLGAYLLPSRLYQTDDKYSLVSGTQSYRDLKLSFVASPSDISNQVRLVAFLALVIARARGWLFSNQRNTFKKTQIIWRLSVGLPSASILSNDLAQRLQHLAAIAWRCAGEPQLLTQGGITQLINEAEPKEVIGAVEVEVIPEIAAQIYGFVVSTSFDRKAANFYLMVDVGAGTVDSCLFRVKPAKGGKWDFEFFTTAVEPHGVMNLHRHRNAWWLDTLKKYAAPQTLIDDVQNGWRDTDHLVSLPEKFEEYFDGVGVTFRKGAKSPDLEFFEDRVVTQVRGKTLWRAWKEEYLDQRSIAGLPLFLCGGGARMAYYLELKNKLKQQHGFSWLKAEPWTMGVPGDLVADGLEDNDYDRVSVAYGLSRLDVGKVIRATPIPKIEIAPVNSWSDNYIDKDQC